MAQREAVPLGYGLIGCGGFGLFAMEHYRQMSEIALVAVADANQSAASAAAKQFDLAVVDSLDTLLARDDVDIVHIATPPFTHHDLVLKALRAGKHVLCEKPLATNLDDANAMLDTSRELNRLLAVNLIMRYNPLCDTVKKIVEENLLGEPLHGFFENYAKDEPLPPGHWFWDREKSGGIFIEHAVHFFDLFQWWLGPGRVESAQQIIRPGANLVEQVNCTVGYEGGASVNFYHGFHQATRMDRQEMRVVFERGSITLDEWVPTSLHIDALVREAALKKLCSLMPGAQVETIEKYSGEDRKCTSRHKPYAVDRRVTISHNVGMSKDELYGHVLRGLLADQVAAILNPKHSRRITEENGLASLEMAVEADNLARAASGEKNNDK